MPTTFSVSSAALRLVAPHVSSEESRPILNGLFLEFGGVMVATNGHTLGAIDAAHNAPESLLLRGDWSKVAKDKGRTASDLNCYAADSLGWVTVTVTGETFVAVNQTTGNAITGRVCEGPYPYWRNVVPTTAPETTPAAFGVDPSLLMKFAPPGTSGPRAVGLYLASRDDRAIRVTRSDAPRFVGIIMPCRLIDPPVLWNNDWWRSTPAPVTVTPETPTDA